MSPPVSAPQPGPCTVDLGQALYVLTDALDLVGVDDVHHGKRVAWLTRRLLEGAGRPELAGDGGAAGLVHDCGVSSSRHHRRLVSDLGLDDTHSEHGARLLARFEPLAHLAEVVRYHHTPWPDLHAVEPRVAFLANAVFLADRLDVLQARLGLRRAVELAARARADLLDPYRAIFHPALVEASLGLVARADVEHLILGNGVAEAEREPGLRRCLQGAEVRGLADLFAHTVDAKSTYTASHSHGVAALALFLGRAVGLGGHALQQLEVAGLLHDLGKLRVPDEVLDKPGPLTPAELKVMRAHAEDSRQILSRIHGFEVIAEVAGMHHESLDGAGYSRGLAGDQVPVAARIVSVADVFQALAQDRPYRRAMELEEILRVLRRLAGAGKLDPRLVAVVEEDPHHCWSLAMVRERLVAPGNEGPVADLARGGTAQA